MANRAVNDPCRLSSTFNEGKFYDKEREGRRLFASFVAFIFVPVPFNAFDHDL